VSIQRSVPFNITIVGAVGLILIGCASGSIHDTADTGAPARAGAKLIRPNHIFVAPIDVSQGTWKAEGDDLVNLRTKVKNDLEGDLVKELAEIAPTSVGSNNSPSDWLVEVTIIHVDPGSAAMRELVGLGAGQSKINVSFSLYDHGNKAISGQVDADTGAEMGLHSVVLEGNGMDAERVAREIRNHLLTHMRY
jgi:hypothetical protein